MARVSKNKRNPLAHGVFDKPIVRPRITLATFLRQGGVENAERWAHDTVNKVKAVKLLGLLGVYGINHNDQNAGLKLALKLAETYIPGFREVDPHRPKGRPRLNSGYKIFTAVTALRREKKGLTVAGACQRLEWLLDQKGKAASFETRYHEYARTSRRRGAT